MLTFRCDLCKRTRTDVWTSECVINVMNDTDCGDCSPECCPYDPECHADWKEI